MNEASHYNFAKLVSCWSTKSYSDTSVCLYLFPGDPDEATKSKTSEDLVQSSKYLPPYSPDPYYQSEPEYWMYSPKSKQYFTATS